MDNIEIPAKMLPLLVVVPLILKHLKNIEAIDNIKSYLPLIAIGLTIWLAYLTSGTLDVWYEPIIPAIAIGLMACGGYDVLKKPKPE
jgi:hypothetical protein